MPFFAFNVEPEREPQHANGPLSGGLFDFTPVEAEPVPANQNLPEQDELIEERRVAGHIVRGSKADLDAFERMLANAR